MSKIDTLHELITELKPYLSHTPYCNTRHHKYAACNCRLDKVVAKTERIVDLHNTRMQRHLDRLAKKVKK